MQLSVASSVIAESSTSFGCGKFEKFTAARLQVTLRGTTCRVISRSGVICDYELLYPIYMYLLYLLLICTLVK